MTDKNTNIPVNNANRFFGHFMRDQHKIYAFILIMVHNRHDAEDVMQEVATILWEKFSTYDDSLSFTAWGIGIARNVIRRYHEAQNKQNRFFRDSIYEALEHETNNILQTLDDEEEALLACLTKLDPKDQNLVALRYEEKLSIKAIAKRVHRSFKGLYQTYARIHGLLQECIKRHLSLQGQTP